MYHQSQLQHVNNRQVSDFATLIVVNSWLHLIETKLFTESLCVYGRTFEEDFLKEGTTVLKVVIPKIVQIWKQLGFPPAKNEERFRTAISHHRVGQLLSCLERAVNQQ